MAGTFKYKPLQSATSTRLILLLRGCERELIACQLQEIEVAKAAEGSVPNSWDEGPQNEYSYTALTYEWGSVDDGEKEILLDGHNFRVRNNLHEALIHLRLVSRPTSLSSESHSYLAWLSHGFASAP